ncbi:MAG: hypothetical protein MK295_09200, partial [Pseudomonadales bacterium]|nr:hypothetical protein [Pseudomonadales bacterium]
VLEREWRERGEPSNVSSPRAAVESLFDIEEGRLRNEPNWDSPTMRDLRSRVQVTLRSSESPKRPTLDVRDFGLGLSAGDFSESILSLNASRKLKKFFLAGAFGQGGSTALAYSPYTIIISRRFDTDEGEDRVAWTVVRFDPGDPSVDKHGIYTYLVDRRTGHPFEIAAADLDTEFPPGTLARHVAMDLGKYHSILTAPTNSLYYLAHHYLFDPVMPFEVGDERESRSSAGKTRPVGGNHRRLHLSEIKEYERSGDFTFRTGTVRITWWVIRDIGEKKPRDRITNYTLLSKPVIITYNGQKQGELPNSIIKKDLKLPYLDGYLVVHVDCDRLDSESRRQLFPTTRESLRENTLLDDLRTLVTDALSGDIDELRKLDNQRKQRYLSSDDNAAEQKVRTRLAKRVKEALTASGGGSGATTLPPVTNPSPQKMPPIPLQDPPTFLKITSPNPRNIYAGRRFTLKFKTDADPGYFSNPDWFIAVINPPSFGQYSGTTNVRDGYGTAYFEASGELDEGERATVTLEVRPPRSKALSDEVEAAVVPFPETSGDGTGNQSMPNITTSWVHKGELFYEDNDWDERSVADVRRSDDEITVFVNQDNKNLAKVLSRAQRRSQEAVDAIKAFYLEHIAFHAVVATIQDEKEEIDNTASADAEANGVTLAEKMRNRELARLSETVSGIIQQQFELIATGAG